MLEFELKKMNCRYGILNNNCRIFVNNFRRLFGQDATKGLLKIIFSFVLISHEIIIILVKQRSDITFGNIPDDESSLDVSSPREINSPSVSEKDI